jgi:hypothetical protein
MPNRIIRDGILQSEAVNSLGWAAEVFYRRLHSIVDDYGRYAAAPALLRAALYALKLEEVSESDIGKWLRECEKAALVRLYSIAGKPHLEVLKFGQKVRTKSKWPDPPDDNLQTSCQQPVSSLRPYTYANAESNANANPKSNLARAHSSREAQNGKKSPREMAEAALEIVKNRGSK